MWKLIVTISAIVGARALYVLSKKKQAYCASCGTCYPQSSAWVRCSACDAKDKPSPEPQHKSQMSAVIDKEMEALHKVFREIEELLNNDTVPNNPTKPNPEKKPTDAPVQHNESGGSVDR